jgi:hypothetical protein
VSTSACLPSSVVDAQRVVQARQGFRRDAQGDDPVHQRQGELAGGQQQQQHQRDALGRPEFQVQLVRCLLDRAERHQHRERQDAADVGWQRRVAGRAQEAGAPRVHGRLERGAAVADQVVADVGLALVAVARWRGFQSQRRRGGELDGLVGHRRLVAAARARHAFDGVAIRVARAEVHPAVHADRILAQDLLDAAEGLDEFGPVRGAQQAQAANAVGHRHLAGRLLLALHVHQVFDRLVGVGQPLFHPRERQRQRGALALQPAREFGDERAAERGARACHVGDHQDQVAGAFFRGLQHARRPGLCQVALVERDGHAHRHAAQVLDQREAQHDREGPQFAQLQLLAALIGRHEAAQRAAAQSPVGVRDGFQCEVVDARQRAVGRHRGLGQPRQFVAVAVREVTPRGADLLVDQVHVVQQPLGGRRHRPVLGNGLAQLAGDVLEHAFVGRQPCQQAVGPVVLREAMTASQQLAVRHHLVAAEQRGAQRFFLFVFAARPGVPGVLACPVGRLCEQGAERAIGSRHQHVSSGSGRDRQARLGQMVSPTVESPTGGLLDGAFDCVVRPS